MSNERERQSSLSESRDINDILNSNGLYLDQDTRGSRTVKIVKCLFCNWMTPLDECFAILGANDTRGVHVHRQEFRQQSTPRETFRDIQLGEDADDREVSLHAENGRRVVQPSGNNEDSNTDEAEGISLDPNRKFAGIQPES